MGREERHKLRAKRHTPEQVIRKLREAEVMLGEGKTIPEVAKALEVSENTFHHWRKQYGGLKAEDAKRLKELETENRQLKQLVADKESHRPGPCGVVRAFRGRHHLHRAQPDSRRMLVHHAEHSRCGAGPRGDAAADSGGRARLGTRAGGARDDGRMDCDRAA